MVKLDLQLLPNHSKCTAYDILQRFSGARLAVPLVVQKYPQSAGGGVQPKQVKRTITTCNMHNRLEGYIVRASPTVSNMKYLYIYQNPTASTAQRTSE